VVGARHEYTYENDSYIAGVFGDLSHHLPYIVSSADATRSTVAELEIPPDALVDEARFTIVAKPGGLATLGSLGQVREGPTASQVVVDLGGMTTIAGVFAADLDLYQRWNGVNFVSAGTGEVQTERLLLLFDSSVDPDDVAGDGSAMLPSIPSSLELLVDGTTVWFERQGSSAGLDVPAAGDGVAYAVDRTDAVREAFAKTGGPVRVELRALTPGNLSLGPSLAVHRVHRVAFPEGPSRTITLDAEGAIVLELPLPGASTGWTVDAVDLVVSAASGSERVLPAVGPLPTSDARLRLPPGRMVLARIPEALRARASTVAGLRVAVRGGVEGGEVSGRLLADAPADAAAVADGTDRPGPAVDGGELTPVLLEPGDEPRWVTLRAARPAGPEARWVELGATYGTVEWELTAVPADDLDTPGAEVLVRRAGGAVRALPVLAEIGPVYGTLRVIVEPDANLPVGALTLGFAGEPESQVPFTPRPEGTAARLSPEVGVTPTASMLTLTGAVATPAAYTFSDIRVTYREEEP
jgi:hypothetical protein